MYLVYICKNILTVIVTRTKTTWYLQPEKWCSLGAMLKVFYFYLPGMLKWCWFKDCLYKVNVLASGWPWAVPCVFVVSDLAAGDFSVTSRAWHVLSHTELLSCGFAQLCPAKPWPPQRFFLTWAKNLESSPSRPSELLHRELSGDHSPQPPFSERSWPVPSASSCRRPAASPSTVQKVQTIAFVIPKLSPWKPH